MTTMNQKQLKAILNYLDVDKDLYDLGDNMRLDACFAIEHTDAGWEVFVTERGSKFDIEVFDNETEACLNLLCRVMKI